jgi:hypothetical protein
VGTPVREMAQRTLLDQPNESLFAEICDAKISTR